MEVNFNNLRKKTCYAYDRLANKLNNAIKEYEKEYSEKGTLMIDCDEIQREMDDLKQLLKVLNLDYAVDEKKDRKISTKDIENKALIQHIEFCIQVGIWSGI